MKKQIYNITILTIIFMIGFVLTADAQTIGRTKTEDFKADFEKKKDISAYLDYDGPKKNIQLLLQLIYIYFIKI